MKKRLTTEEFIRRAREVHGDKYDYSKVNYINANTKVCIICPGHGEFWQRPSGHLRGLKCDKCGGSYDISKEEFIKRAKTIHGNKYDYSEIKYKNLSHYIYVKCPIHGAFKIMPGNHIRGRGCPKCGIIKRKRKICGIGINDYIGHVIINNKPILSYQVWKDMIIRCYDGKNITYRDCYVCNDWIRFSNFKKWFDKHYIEGYVLDKDIVSFGNKVYSPENCIFIPKFINSVFRSSHKYGIQKTKYGTFRIMYGKKYLGTFKSDLEAIIIISDYFINHVKYIIDKYIANNMINKYIADKMMEYSYKRKEFLLKARTTKQ